MALKLQHKDACIVTRYTRDELHAVLTAIGFKGSEPARERVPQQYSGLDLIVLAIVSDLDRKFGVRRKVLASIYPELRRALSVPRIANQGAKLVVTITPPAVRYTDEQLPVDEGIVLPLRDVFERVDSHVGVYGPAQSLLHLRPTLLTNSVTAKRRHRAEPARDTSKRTKKVAQKMGGRHDNSS